MTGHSSNLPQTVPAVSPINTAQIEATVELLCAQLSEHSLPSNLGEVRKVIATITSDERYGFILGATSPSGQVVGVALACAYLGVEHGGVSGWLEELYVLPAWRAKGLGSQLVAEVTRVARARHWRALDLEVTSDHQRVIPLYLRHGFEPRPRSRFYLKLD